MPQKSKLKILDRIVRVAGEERQENVRFDVCVDPMNRAISEAEVPTARMKTINFLVVVTIEEAIAATVVDNEPIRKVRP